MWLSTRLRSALLVLAGVVLLGACGASIDGVGVQTSEGATWADLPYLGHGSRAAPNVMAAEWKEESEVGGQAFTDCMISRGVPDAQMVLDSDTAVANMVVHPASLEDARDKGFGMTALRQRGRVEFAQAAAESEPDSLQAAGQEQSDSPGQEDAEVAAFMECQQARLKSDAAEVSEIVHTYRAEVLSDPAVGKAFSDWRTCMADAGFPVESLSQLASELSASHQPHAFAYLTEMSDAERADYDKEFLSRESDAAVATVECDQQVLAEAFGRWSALEEQWMDKHADLVRSAPVAGKYFLSITLDL